MVESELIRPEDKCYVHSLLLQCFLPVRHNKENALEWQAINGNASLLIRAGVLMNPKKQHDFIRCVVPAGPKARIAMAYINNQAYRHGPEIPLGKNVHKFMLEAGVSVGGNNSTELKKELDNVVAANIVLGTWTPGAAPVQEDASVTSGKTFWQEEDEKGRRVWKKTVRLSPEYYKSLMEGGHSAPIYLPAFLRLQKSPRAMDLFAYMSYRLHAIPERVPLLLKRKALHALFGREIALEKHFWPEFLATLQDVSIQYPEARFEVLNDCVRFWRSPSPIPGKRLE